MQLQWQLRCSWWIKNCLKDFGNFDHAATLTSEGVASLNRHGGSDKVGLVGCPACFIDPFHVISVYRGGSSTCRRRGWGCHLLR